MALGWLTVLNSALNKQLLYAARSYNLKLMSGDSSQPISINFIKVCITMGVEQSFTSYGNPKRDVNHEQTGERD